MEFVIEPTRVVDFVENKLYIGSIKKIDHDGGCHMAVVNVSARVGDDIIHFKFTYHSLEGSSCIKNTIKSMCMDFIAKYNADHFMQSAMMTYNCCIFDFQYHIYRNVYGLSRNPNEIQPEDTQTQEFLRTFA